MKCEEFQSLLGLRREGALPEELELRVERHLLRCPQCAYEVQSQEQAYRMLCASFLPTEASPSFRERTLAKLADRFADRLRPVVPIETGRQWALPLLKEE